MRATKSVRAACASEAVTASRRASSNRAMMSSMCRAWGLRRSTSTPSARIVGNSLARLYTRADWVCVPLSTRKPSLSRVRSGRPSAWSRQLNWQSSLGRLRWRAVKQRAEYASGMRP
ncbi:hypothetical protein D3C71_1730890 [compost metagenome]